MMSEGPKPYLDPSIEAEAERLVADTMDRLQIVARFPAFKPTCAGGGGDKLRLKSGKGVDIPGWEDALILGLAATADTGS